MNWNRAKWQMLKFKKMGYYFPGQRAACYSSDMVMRQYERVRSRKGKDFSYKDLKKVYTIVIMEKSSKEFIFVSLDIFMEIKDNENIEALDELDAWLYFLGSDKPRDIQKH